MMKRHAASTRAQRAPLRLALFVTAAAIATGAAVPSASAQEDTSLTATILGGLGLVPQAPPDIDYRERAPLVVPSNPDILPPPRDSSVTTNNPAWPKDYDQEQRKKQAALEKPTTNWTGPGMDPRPLSPGEMAKGRGKPVSGNTGSGFNTQGDNRLSLKELDFRGWGNKNDKPIVFEGEPEREALVQPPPGYQTPAPNAPYGVVEEKKKTWKMPSWFDTAQPNGAQN